VAAVLTNDVVGVSASPASSVVVRRDKSDVRNLSGGVETFVPARLLLGVVPHALLDEFLFWQDEASEPRSLVPNGVADDDNGGETNASRGYRRLRGYPVSEKTEYIIIVEFKAIGSWEEELSEAISFDEDPAMTAAAAAAAGTAEDGGSSSSGSGSFAKQERIEATGLPGRSVRILRRPKAMVLKEFEASAKLATELESLGLLRPPKKNNGKRKRGGGKKDDPIADLLDGSSSAARAARGSKGRGKGGGGKGGGKGGKSEKPAFSVGESVEFDTDGSGGRWVKSEVLKVWPNGQFFDLEPSEPWVGRQTRVPPLFLRKPGQQSNEEGVGVWKFEGLTDSEDEDFRADFDGSNGGGFGDTPEDSDDSESDDEDEDEDEDGAKDDVAYGAITAEEKAEATRKKRAAKVERKRTLTFAQFDRLRYVLDAVGGDVTLATTVCRKLAAQGGGRGMRARRSRRNRAIAEGGGGAARTIRPFTDPFLLAAAVAREVSETDFLSDRVASLLEAREKERRRVGKAASEEEYELLNVLTAPRKSRLHSIAKSMARVETLSHVLAWTKKASVDDMHRPLNFPFLHASSTKNGKSTSGGLDDLVARSYEKGCEFRAMLGCPNVDLVELPRLKLAFSMRKDEVFNGRGGEDRLYSLDHSDLFITNDRHPAVNQMLQGIPHSLLLANLKGELQVLVPVLRPVRPVVKSQPFTTMLVMDRSSVRWNAALSSRYYMYPVHVSASFLLTKGLNAALYLMLLRFLHRDYDEVFRLTDSIATDTALNAEGAKIFEALSFTCTDCHPDAHACRLKISLVTIDSGSELPWDLTTEAAKHVVKLAQVAATCRLSLEEELQLLESGKHIVLDDKHADYDANSHTHYVIALVKNRLHSLRALQSALGAAGTIVGGGGGGGGGERGGAFEEDGSWVSVSPPLSPSPTLAIAASAAGDEATNGNDVGDGSGSGSGSGGPKLGEALVFHPPREVGSAWPFHMDNSVLGEEYASAMEIESGAAWRALLATGSVTLPLLFDGPFARFVALRNFRAAHPDFMPAPKAPKHDVEDERKGGEQGAEGGSEDEASVATGATIEDVIATPEGVIGWANKEQESSSSSLVAISESDHPLRIDSSSSSNNNNSFTKNATVQYPGASPKGGYLNVVVFQVLWSDACLSAIPSIEELAPSYPAAKFCTVRADRVGLDEVSRENDVKQFPTVLVMRGEREVGRVVGHERCAVRLTQLLRQQITAEDMEFQAARRQQEIEDAGGAGEEEEEEEDLQWTWDPEYASDDIRTLQYGTVVAMVKQEEEDGEPLESVKWQVQKNRRSDDFEDLPQDVCLQLEKAYRSGRLFLDGNIMGMGEGESAVVTLTSQDKCSIEGDFIKGLECELASEPYNRYVCRRKGARHPVKGDEKYVSEAQKLADKWLAEHMKKEKEWRARKEELNKGKDIQGIRGTNALTEDTGTYKWTLKWGHEPGRAGGGDAIGLGELWTDNEVD
jgi:hypothetical protein